mmetsp:Transcript_138347/g.442117  ORF Transcript_138347/g.442117 Transcript_138347/m.442117 type:complete len:247 (-) Transcript_138347:12-752(-)
MYPELNATGPPPLCPPSMILENLPFARAQSTATTDFNTHSAMLKSCEIAGHKTQKPDAANSINVSAYCKHMACVPTLHTYNDGAVGLPNAHRASLLKLGSLGQGQLNVASCNVRPSPTFSSESIKIYFSSATSLNMTFSPTIWGTSCGTSAVLPWTRNFAPRICNIDSAASSSPSPTASKDAWSSCLVAHLAGPPSSQREPSPSTLTTKHMSAAPHQRTERSFIAYLKIYLLTNQSIDLQVKARAK